MTSRDDRGNSHHDAYYEDLEDLVEIISIEPHIIPHLAQKITKRKNKLSRIYLESMFGISYHINGEKPSLVTMRKLYSLLSQFHPLHPEKISIDFVKKLVTDSGWIPEDLEHQLRRKLHIDFPVIYHCMPHNLATFELEDQNRFKDIKLVRDYLQSPDHVIISITGKLGTGKTWIAHKIAYDLINRVESSPLRGRFRYIVYVDRPSLIPDDSNIHYYGPITLRDLAKGMENVLYQEGNTNGSLITRALSNGSDRQLLDVLFQVLSVNWLFIFDRITSDTDQAVLRFIERLHHPNKAILLRDDTTSSLDFGDFLFLDRPIELSQLEGDTIRHIIDPHNALPLRDNEWQEIYMAINFNPLAANWLKSHIKESTQYTIANIINALNNNDNVLEYLFHENIETIERRDPSYLTLLSVMTFSDPKEGLSIPEIAFIMSISEDRVARYVHQLSQDIWDVVKKTAKGTIIFSHPLLYKYLVTHVVPKQKELSTLRHRLLQLFITNAKIHGGSDWDDWDKFSGLNERANSYFILLQDCIKSNQYEVLCTLCGPYGLLDHFTMFFGYWEERQIFHEWLRQEAYNRQDWDTYAGLLATDAWLLTMINPTINRDRSLALLKEAWEYEKNVSKLTRLLVAYEALKVSLRINDLQAADYWLKVSEQVQQSIEENDIDHLVDRHKIDRRLPSRYKIHINYYKGIFHIQQFQSHKMDRINTDLVTLANEAFTWTAHGAEMIDWLRGQLYARAYLAEIAIYQGRTQDALDILNESQEKFQHIMDLRYNAQICLLFAKVASPPSAIEYAEQAVNYYTLLNMQRELGEAQHILETLRHFLN